MILRTSHLALLLLGLTACKSHEPTYDPSKAYDLVIYRPDSFIGTVHKAYLFLNGAPLCTLENGGFVTANLKTPGSLSATSLPLPGRTEMTVNPPAYIKVEQRHSLAGVPGWESDAEAASAGPFTFTVVPVAQAQKELQGSIHQCVSKS